LHLVRQTSWACRLLLLLHLIHGAGLPLMLLPHHHALLHLVHGAGLPLLLLLLPHHHALLHLVHGAGLPLLLLPRLHLPHQHPLRSARVRVVKVRRARLPVLRRCPAMLLHLWQW
jgi:hypothetical protein